MNLCFKEVTLAAVFRVSKGRTGIRKASLEPLALISLRVDEGRQTWLYFGAGVLRLNENWIWSVSVILGVALG